MISELIRKHKTLEAITSFEEIPFYRITDTSYWKLRVDTQLSFDEYQSKFYSVMHNSIPNLTKLSIGSIESKEEVSQNFLRIFLIFIIRSIFMCFY